MIPDDVRRFVLASIPSIPYLELALLFRRDRSATRSPAAVSKVLYVSEANAGELLSALADAGIIAPQAGVDNAFVYAPRGPDLDDALARLDDCYRRDIALLRSTRETFFLYFVLSFWMQAVNPVVMALTHSWDEDTPGQYLVRLASYMLIVLAIWSKNRRR